jgi:Zn-dependent protease
MFLLTLFSDPIHFSRIVLILIISITLHELGHGFAALSQGDDTPRTTGHITLNPVVHMGVPSLIFLVLTGITWGAMPVNPSRFRVPIWSDVLVSAAGPLTNLGLGFLAILILKLMYVTDTRVLSETFFLMFAQINVVLCLFNLLPIPPLDGFHICSELIPSLKPMRYSPYGMLILVVVFIVVGLGSILSTLANLIVNQLLISI